MVHSFCMSFITCQVAFSNYILIISSAVIVIFTKDIYESLYDKVVFFNLHALYAVHYLHHHFLFSLILFAPVLTVGLTFQNLY